MGQVPSELLRDGLLVRDLRQRQWKHANCLLSVTVRARADDAKHGVSTPSRRCDWESQDRVLRARLVRRVLEWYCVTHYRTSLDRVTVSCLKHIISALFFATCPVVRITTLYNALQRAERSVLSSCFPLSFGAHLGCKALSSSRVSSDLSPCSAGPTSGASVQPKRHPGRFCWMAN